MNPTNNIIGITHHVNEGSPMIKRSVAFMEVSIAIIEIRDIPIATLNASLIPPICLIKMKVSSAIEVMIPLNIASIIIDIADQPRASRYGINWKAKNCSEIANTTANQAPLGIVCGLPPNRTVFPVEWFGLSVYRISRIHDRESDIFIVW